VVGNRTKVKVVKNKIAPPFKEAEFDIIYGEGISRSGDVLDLAVSNDIIKKSGAWYSYGEERIGQGRQNAKQFLVEHPATMQEVESVLMEKYSIKKSTSQDKRTDTPEK